MPNEASLNVEHDPEQLLKKYAIEIADLKRELAMHDSLASRSRVAYEPYSDQQRLALREELQAFLNAKDDGGGGGGSDINIESVRQMRELLSAMKTLYGKQAAELEKYQALLANGGSAGAAGGIEGGLPAPRAGWTPSWARARAWATQRTRGAASQWATRPTAAPQGGLVEPPAYQREGGGEGGEEGDGVVASGSFVGAQEGAMGRDAYAAFKKAEGAEVNQRLLTARRRPRRHA